MTILFWWLFVGGIISSAMIGGPIYANPLAKTRTKALLFFLLGPAMWSVLVLSLAFGGVMALVHKYNAAAKKG